MSPYVSGFLCLFEELMLHPVMTNTCIAMQGALEPIVAAFFWCCAGAGAMAKWPQIGVA